MSQGPGRRGGGKSVGTPRQDVRGWIDVGEVDLDGCDRIESSAALTTATTSPCRAQNSVAVASCLRDNDPMAFDLAYYIDVHLRYELKYLLVDATTWTAVHTSASRRGAVAIG